MTVRIDEHGCLIVGNCALPAAVVPAVEAFYREQFEHGGVVAEEPEAARIITTEVEANTLPVGSIIRDNMGDARQKVSERGWEQSGVVGWWGPTWVAFPAEVVWVPVKQKES